MKAKRSREKSVMNVLTLVLSVTVSVLCLVLWRDRWWTSAIGGGEVIVGLQALIRLVSAAAEQA